MENQKDMEYINSRTNIFDIFRIPYPTMKNLSANWTFNKIDNICHNASLNKLQRI